jgi:hypothetical protein
LIGIPIVDVMVAVGGVVSFEFRVAEEAEAELELGIS